MELGTLVKVVDAVLDGMYRSLELSIKLTVNKELYYRRETDLSASICRAGLEARVLFLFMASFQESKGYE